MANTTPASFRRDPERDHDKESKDRRDGEGDTRDN
jgi:hypothetical protein